MASIITNVYLWIGLTLFFVLIIGVLIILLVVLKMKTHAIIEFKAWLTGSPIALFFQENRYCEWKAVKPDAGIVQDKDYGAFIVNDKATYIDKTTKNVLLPFDSSFGAGINVHAAKLADDLQYIVKDEEQLKTLRFAIANDLLDDSSTIDALKTSIHFGALKNMMTALIPHNINAKIEKVIASRMKGMGTINIPQVILVFAAIFGAVVLGALIIKIAFPSKS